MVKKHRADGAIKSIKIGTARVDATYTGILSGNFSFSGRATVSVAGVAPFTVAFRERITGSLVAGNNRLLDHWFFPQRRGGRVHFCLCVRAGLVAYGSRRGKRMQTTWAIASRRPSPFANS